MTADYVLGIDLGGTKIAAGVFAGNRKLIGEISSAATGADQPAEATLANLKRAADEARRAAGCDARPPLAVGIGSTGPVEAATGRVLDAPSLPKLHFFDLGAWIRREIGAPLFIENDANCFALGEARQGAGKGHDVVVAVTLGTGFGCGIVIHGAMYSGVSGNAGEVANCPVASGTFDEMLSGAGVRRFYERFHGPHQLSAKQIGDRAEAGDVEARQAWRDFGDAVGAALGTIAAVVDPSICIVGGSVAARLPLFEDALQARLKSIVAAPIPVAPAQLGASAGVIGAAEYAFYRLERS